MDDKPLEDMTNDELMDLGIAENEFGLDGWIDSIVNAGVHHVATFLVNSQILAETQTLEPEEIANLLHIAIQGVLQGTFDAGRRVGQREGKGEL